MREKNPHTFIGFHPFANTFISTAYDDEWKLAKQALKYAPPGTQIFPENYPNQQLRHTFLKIDHQITCALAGEDWHINSAYAQLIPAVTQACDFIMLKIPHDMNLIPTITEENKKFIEESYENEVRIAKLTGIGLAETKAQRKGKPTEFVTILIMRLLQTDLYDFVTPPLLDHQDKIWLLTEQELSQNTINTAFFSLLAAIKLWKLHADNFLHLDFKPENTLINPHDDWNKVELELCDFGFSQQSDYQGKAILTFSGFIMGTKNYLAPEIQSGNGRENHYSTQTDIFAFGASQLTILKYYLYELILINEKYKLHYDFVCDLKCKLTDKNPDKRPSFFYITISLLKLLVTLKLTEDAKQQRIANERLKSAFNIESQDSLNILKHLFIYHKDIKTETSNLIIKLLAKLDQTEMPGYLAHKLLKFNDTTPDSIKQLLISKLILCSMYFLHKGGATSDELNKIWNDSILINIIKTMTDHRFQIPDYEILNNESSRTQLKSILDEYTSLQKKIQTPGLFSTLNDKTKIIAQLIKNNLQSTIIDATRLHDLTEEIKRLKLPEGQANFVMTRSSSPLQPSVL